MRKYVYRKNDNGDDVIYWFDDDILYFLDCGIIEKSNYNYPNHRHKIATEFHSYTLGKLIKQIREYEKYHTTSFPTEHLKAILIQISQEIP